MADGRLKLPNHNFSPKLKDGSYRLADGSLLLPDGNIRYANGTTRVALPRKRARLGGGGVGGRGKDSAPGSQHHVCPPPPARGDMGAREGGTD